MNYKIGQKLYSARGDESTGRCELCEYRVKTIRGRFVYAVHFIQGLTWVKKSKKHGDFGWSDDVAWARVRTILGEKFRDLHSTKRQAWVNLKKTYEDVISDDELFDGVDDPEYINCEKIIKTATTRIKTLSK